MIDKIELLYNVLQKDNPDPVLFRKDRGETLI